MLEQPTLDGPLQYYETPLWGRQLLNDALLNKGIAFTESERDEFELRGLLPPHVGTLQEQVARALAALRSLPDDLERYRFLREMQDGNETSFVALLTQNLEELLPVVYTPTVGAGCQLFSQNYHKPRGLFLSPLDQARLPQILASPCFDEIEAIVVTDGERILGLGDQGAGGMGISIGKLALYTGCGGLHPRTTLPVLLDVGTDNAESLADPLYVGWRHERVRGAEYDTFVDAFVSAVTARWPHVLLQWEDFARANAYRLLERYRNRLCTFNDDIQGTAAVAAGTLLATINVTGVPITEQRLAILGAGSAGCGIAALLLHAMVDAGMNDKDAASRFCMIDRDGLLVQGMQGILPSQRPFLQDRSTLANWQIDHADKIELLDVIRNAKPTALIGVCGQPGAFTETAIREMAVHTERPVILPLSNPTSHSEATPEDLLRWTAGRAVIATGSPFPPIVQNGCRRHIDQTNNSYIFPGMGLGVISVRSRRVTDRMFMAAAKALAEASPARYDPDANLLPPISALRDVACAVALAASQEAHKEGLTEGVRTDTIEASIHRKVWTPHYVCYRRHPSKTLNVSVDRAAF